MGDHAIWAESPWFSLRRNRPIAPKKRQGWRRNRTSARVSRPTSVFCSAELTTRKGKDKHARNSPTKCRLGTVASLVCPAAFSALAQRKPMAAKESGDVAVSAVSRWIFSRRRRPLGLTKATLAKELSGALRRQRRRCVVPRRATPSRRNETDARAPSQRDRPFFGFRHCHFPGGSGHVRGQDRSRNINLREARVRHCFLGYFSVGSDHAGGEKLTTADKLDWAPRPHRGLR